MRQAPGTATSSGPAGSRRRRAADGQRAGGLAGAADQGRPALGPRAGHGRWGAASFPVLRLIEGAGPQQRGDQAHQLARGQDHRALVGVLGRLGQLSGLEVPVLGAVQAHTVGRLDQVVAQIGIAGLGEGRVLGLEGARLVRVPDQTGVLGQRRIVGKAPDVAALGDQAGRPDRPQAGDRTDGALGGEENRPSPVYSGAVSYTGSGIVCCGESRVRRSPGGPTDALACRGGRATHC